MQAFVTRRQVLEKPVSAHVPSTTRSTHPGSGQYTPPSAVSSWPGVDADVVQHQQAADNSQALFYLPSVRHGGRRPLADEAACVVWLHLHVLEVLNSVADDDAVADIAASEWCSGVPNGFNQPLQSQLDQQPLPASEALAAASAGSCEASAQQQGVAAAQAAAGSPVGGPGDDSDAADVEPPSKRTCRRVPDFSLLDKPWTADGRLCVVGEAKRPEVMQHIGGDLVSKWNEQDSTAQQVVAQLNEYMQHYNTSYGCITSLAHTWLARRHPEHPAGLQLSAGIPLASNGADGKPAVRGALSFLQHVAVAQPEQQLRSGSLFEPGSDDAADASSFGSGAGSPGSHGTAPEPAQGGTGGAEGIMPSARHGQRQASDDVKQRQEQGPSSEHSDVKRCEDQLAALPPASLPAPPVLPSEQVPAGLPALPTLTRGQLHLRHLIGRGATGLVHAGRWQGQPAAIKLLRVPGWEPAAGFAWEARVYRCLRQLQGTCVPRLLGQGYTDGGREYFMALSLVCGTPLDRLPAPLHGDVKRAAMATLGLVHSAGVLHGDICLRHLWLLQRPNRPHGQPGPGAGEAAAGGSSSTPTVMLLDFGNSRISRAAAQQMGAERQQLQALLDAA